MKNVLNKIINAGIPYAKDQYDVKNIYIMNRMSAILAVMMLFFCLLGPLIKLYDILFFAVPFAFSFSLSIYFNHKGWLSFNKYYFALAPLVCISSICFYNSIQLGDRFFFFATATIPVILFRKKIIIFSLFYLNVAAFFFISWYQSTHAPVVQVPHEAEVQYWCFGLFFVFSIIYFVVRNLKQGSEEYEEVIEKKNELITLKNKEIVDSINYAKKIQNTLLAHNDFLQKYLPNHFVLFKPKDIVSGDFYWATEHNNQFYLAVCDSTGHGVPGAFMCLLNIGFLNEAIKEKNISQPNLVFEQVRKRLIADISKEGQQDGMDGILLKLHTVNNLTKIEYAGANNSPVLIRNNGILILETDKMPVGKGERKETFRSFFIDAQAGDVLYLYTDGFADQFGGPKGKKFKYKALNELLLLHHHQSTAEQKEILNTVFESWKGNLEQVDDVCIIGIKF